MLGLRPMNLTTMLSNAGSRELAHVVNKRNSDSSLSPRSPPGMDHDSRDEIVDPRIDRDHDIDDDIGKIYNWLGQYIANVLIFLLLKD